MRPLVTERADLSGIDTNDPIVHDENPARPGWTRCGIWLGEDMASFVAPAEVTEEAWCPLCVPREGA